MERSYRRIDPRTALLSICLLGTAAMLSNRPEAAHAACAIGVACALVSGAWRSCITLSAAYGLIAAVMALAERVGSTTLMTAVVMLSYMAQKFVVLALLGVSLSKLASMQDLLAALQSMGAPQVVLIPCTVILRFFPTIRRDASHLVESLKTRRVLAGGGFAFIPVPLLMRSVRISDELAASALARGLDGEAKATVLRPLSFGGIDAVAAALTLLATGVLAWLQFGPR